MLRSFRGHSGRDFRQAFSRYSEYLAGFANFVHMMDGKTGMTKTDDFKDLTTTSQWLHQIIAPTHYLNPFIVLTSMFKIT